MSPIALTGASGFVGRAVAARLAAEGLRPRLLLRRPDPALEALAEGVVRGDLRDPAALAALVEGAETVVHLGGLVAAVRPEAFHAVNAEATGRLAQAAAEAGVRRFLLVSSLAAREPGVSPYAASKRAAEALLAEAAPGLARCVLRPPGVYGPGDRATLPIFRQLSAGLVAMPAVPGARFSLLFVEDLAAAVAALLSAPEAPAWDGLPLALDDGAATGYAWGDLAAIAAERLGRPVRLLRLPPVLLAPLAWGGAAWARLSGRPAMLAPGKLRELAWADWVARAEPERLPPQGRPQTGFAEGLMRTLAWYEEKGWLRARRA